MLALTGHVPPAHGRRRPTKKARRSATNRKGEKQWQFVLNVRTASKGVKAPENSTGRKTVCPLCRNELIIPEKKVVNVPKGEADSRPAKHEGGTKTSDAGRKSSSQSKEEADTFEAEVQGALDTPDEQESESNSTQAGEEEIRVADDAS